ncbi:MAG: DUF2341 domain-containing protein [Dehalococcoidales bacterium]|nr:DUF2341 domain-containing protein [Dehalococcoidales bacterium]
MAWYNVSWGYRKSIVIAGSSDGAQSGYQLKLLVGKTSSASGEDVDCNGHCQDDFDDLRFTKSDGTTLLDYWIESISGSGSTALATVWIEVDSIAASPSTTTIYMYYSNSGASAYSNGENTFPSFFEHFNGTLSKWSGDTSYASLSGSIMSYSANNSWHGMSSNAESGLQKFGIRMYAKMMAAGGAAGGRSGGAAYLYVDGSGLNPQIVIGDTGETQINTNWVANSWMIFDINILAGVSVRWYKNGTECSNSPRTTSIPSSTTAPLINAHFQGWAYTVNVQCDWILFRKHTANQPVWSSFGSEETSSQTYELSLADSVKAGESTVKPVLTIKFSLTEGLKGGDGMAYPRLSNPLLSDELDLSDFSTYISYFEENLLDGLKASVILSTLLKVESILTDGITGSDTDFSQALIQSALYDVCKFSEILTQQLIAFPSLNDVVKASDNSATWLLALIGLFDGVKAGDAQSYVYIIPLALADAVNLIGGAGRLIGSGDESGDSNVDIDTFHLSKFTARYTGKMRYIYIRAAGTGSIKLAIYADNAGEPGDLIAALNDSQSLTEGWNKIAFPSIDITAGTVYWLGFNSE